MPPQRTQRQHNLCRHCRQTFPTVGALRRHTGQSQQCYSELLRLDADAERTRTAAHTESRDRGSATGEREGCHTHASYEVDQLDDIDDTTRAELEASGGSKPSFPRFADEFCSHSAVADILGTDLTSFERMKMSQDSMEKDTYAPFADHDEWGLAQWLIKNMNQRETDEFLKLPIVSRRSHVDLTGTKITLGRHRNELVRHLAATISS